MADIRDRSLITGRGAINGGGGGQVLPLPKKQGDGGGGECFSHYERGSTKCFGVVLTRELEVRAIRKGGGANKVFTLLMEGGWTKSLTLSWGGGGVVQKGSDPIL